MPLQTTSALQDKEKWSTRLITFFQAWSDQMSQVFGVVKIFQLKFLLNNLNRQWCRSRKSDRSRNLWSLLTSCGLRSRLWAAHLDWSRCSPDKTETKNSLVTWVPNNLLGGVKRITSLERLWKILNTSVVSKNASIQIPFRREATTDDAVDKLDSNAPGRITTCSGETWQG